MTRQRRVTQTSDESLPEIMELEDEDDSIVCVYRIPHDTAEADTHGSSSSELPSQTDDDQHPAAEEQTTELEEDAPSSDAHTATDGSVPDDQEHDEAGQVDNVQEEEEAVEEEENDVDEDATGGDDGNQSDHQDDDDHDTDAQTRRSTRTKKPPAWMRGGEYIMMQHCHSLGDVIRKAEYLQSLAVLDMYRGMEKEFAKAIIGIMTNSTVK